MAGRNGDLMIIHEQTLGPLPTLAEGLVICGKQKTAHNYTLPGWRPVKLSRLDCMMNFFSHVVVVVVVVVVVDVYFPILFVSVTAQLCCGSTSCWLCACSHRGSGRSTMGWPLSGRFICYICSSHEHARSQTCYSHVRTYVTMQAEGGGIGETRKGPIYIRVLNCETRSSKMIMSKQPEEGNADCQCTIMR